MERNWLPRSLLPFDKDGHRRHFGSLPIFPMRPKGGRKRSEVFPLRVRPLVPEIPVVRARPFHPDARDVETGDSRKEKGGEIRGKEKAFILSCHRGQLPAPKFYLLDESQART